MEISKTEKIWNLVSLFTFVLLIIFLGTLLDSMDLDIRDMSLFDFAMIALATYRMTRLMVYDRIFKLIRDLIKKLRGSGIGDSLKAIITCPWCAGVWIALVNIAVFFLAPWGTLFIYAMAIAGTGTLLQIGVNIMGIIAESKQIDLKEKRSKTNFKKP